MGKQIVMRDYVCKRCGQAFRSALRNQNLCKPCAEKLEKQYSVCSKCGKALSPAKAGTKFFRTLVLAGYRYCHKCAAELSNTVSQGYNKVCRNCGKAFVGVASNSSLCETCVKVLTERFSKCSVCKAAFDKPPKHDKLTTYLNAGHRYCAVCAGKMSGESRRGKGTHYGEPKPKEKKAPVMSLADCIREAAKHGMTYGQYVQMMEGRT